MGKKKIATQTQEEILKEEAALQSAEVKAGKGSVSKRVDAGRVYVKASFNNTVVTATDKLGNVLAWATAGSMGFSGPKKATPFAASKIIAAIAEKLKKSGPIDIEVIVSGVGGGRDSSVRSLINQGFNVLSIKDVTPIPHNGVRRPKVRRV
ncbi:MAG TPA: 30S ribosomal protein S11 [Candidatus Paceibacterota bacterium]